MIPPSRTALKVNIDHVATVREARRGKQPDPLDAGRAALAAGADHHERGIRLSEAGQVIEWPRLLIRRVVLGRNARAEHKGDAIADAVEQRLASRGELGERQGRSVEFDR